MLKELIEIEVKKVKAESKREVARLEGLLRDYGHIDFKNYRPYVGPRGISMFAYEDTKDKVIAYFEELLGEPPKIVARMLGASTIDVTATFRGDIKIWWTTNTPELYPLEEGYKLTERFGIKVIVKEDA